MRNQFVIFVGLIMLMVGWIYLHLTDHTTASRPPAASASAVTAAASAAVTAAASAPVVVHPDDADAPQPTGAGGGGGAGGGLPSLADAPKAVRFGVILVKYAGAQLAKKDTRSKKAAAKLADELAKQAQSDFEAAVKKGDKGSTANAGRMFRGLLESDAEYALFSLEKGAVSKPVDTPRGFWILKRLE